MNIEEDGVEQQEVTTPPAEKPGKGSKEPETVTLTKAEVEALRREAKEARDSERFWAEKARGGKADPEPEPDEEIEPEPDEEPEVDPEKFVDELAKNGPKALRKYGFVTRAEAERMAEARALRVADQVVDRKVKSMQTDADLMREFPDLKDQKSELWKETATRYQRALARNPKSKDDPNTLFLAAEAAAEALKAREAANPKPRRDDDYDRYDPEEDRRARADAQGASRGRRAPVVDDDATELGPEALAICQQMGIKPEDFMKSQKDLGTRRRR